MDVSEQEAAIIRSLRENGGTVTITVLPSADRNTATKREKPHAISKPHIASEDWFSLRDREIERLNGSVGLNDSDQAFFSQQFVTASEAAEWLAIGNPLVRRYCNDGRLFGEKRDGKWHVDTLSCLYFTAEVPDPRLSSTSELET